MPHKDRHARLAYLDDYRAVHRPAPATVAQGDASLPVIGAIEFDEAGERVRCHVCGRWYKALNAHLRLHGMDAEAYKETYGIARTASLWPPALQAKQREAALARDQGSVGRQHLPEGSSRPRGLAARLSSRVEASKARAGVNTRAGERARD